MRLLQVLVPQVEKICIDKWAQTTFLKYFFNFLINSSRLLIAEA